jgi:hypothetical protein
MRSDSSQTARRLAKGELIYSVRPEPDITTGETTSHLTVETTSHPTKQPKDGCQVVGYKPACGQVAGYVEGLVGYSLTLPSATTTSRARATRYGLAAALEIMERHYEELRK